MDDPQNRLDFIVKSLFNPKMYQISILDIYIYLNNSHLLNDPHSISSHNSNEEKRKKLINKCKYIRSLFENEFYPCLDDVDSSYLEMGGKINIGGSGSAGITGSGRDGE